MAKRGAEARAQRSGGGEVEVETDEAKARKEDARLRMAVAIRKKYAEMTGKYEARPKKIVEHRDFDVQGRQYKLLWYDHGDRFHGTSQWKPKDYVAQFDGLLESYESVIRPWKLLLCFCCDENADSAHMIACICHMHENEA